MTQPIRIQRTRKAIVNPETDTLQARSLAANGLPVVCVGRGSKWGNPFRIGDEIGDVPAWLVMATEYGDLPVDTKLTGEMVIRLFDLWARKRLDVSPLRGKNLACWCAPSSKCHADILLRLANE